MNNMPVTPWEDQFYDPALFEAAAGDAYSDEVEAIYFNVIGAAPKKMVEFGCGTGRVILKLALKGHEVTGVDISINMLNCLREKMNFLPAEVAARINIVCADGKNVSISGKKQIAIAVDDFLTHFLDEGEVERVLLQVASCLDPAGIFITDLRARDPEKLQRAQVRYPKQFYTYGIVNGVQVEQEIFSASMKYWEDYDVTTRVLCSHQVFDFIRSGGEVEKTVYKTIRQKILTRQELETIADRAGFRLRQFIPIAPDADHHAGVYVFQCKA